jgi:hypothetical protein
MSFNHSATFPAVASQRLTARDDQSGSMRWFREISDLNLKWVGIRNSGTDSRRFSWKSLVIVELSQRFFAAWMLNVFSYTRWWLLMHF